MDPRMAITPGSKEEYNFGERDGSARPNNPGVYFHPGAQKFIETSGIRRPDGSMAYNHEHGKIQADALVQQGFLPASDEELKEYQAQQEKATKAEQIKKSRITTAMSSPARK